MSRSRLTLIANAQRDTDYPQTADTIARAKLYNRRERDRVFEETGLRITDSVIDVDPVVSLMRAMNAVCSVCYPVPLEPVIGPDPRD